MYRLDVMNPVAPVLGEVEATPMAPRPASLKGKTIGLVWNGKANGDVALRRAGELVQQRVPGVKVKFYSGALPTPTALMDQAIREVDAAIGCTAD
jgi:hypothetical protein|tara:strand:+ start:120 stop:404 length:285 start_codon:yes stop_codon:yes gene_type:complete